MEMTGYKIGMIHTSCLNEDGCNYNSWRYTNVKDVASTSQITRNVIFRACIFERRSII